MTGTDRPGMVLQERDRHLLRELSVMRVADREQVRSVAGFSSTTRVNARLLALTRSGLLRRFFLGTKAGGAKALYAATEKGARLVETPYRSLRRSNDQMLVADFFVQHQLAINDVYVALKYRPAAAVPQMGFVRWVSFQQPIAPGLLLIPDGYVELRSVDGALAAFIEVDLGHERLSVWKKKAENYLQLAVSGEFGRRFGQSRFRVLVLAHSEGRMFSIRKTVAAVTDRIFWFSTLSILAADALLFTPVWLRAKGNERQSLIHEIP